MKKPSPVLLIEDDAALTAQITEALRGKTEVLVFGRIDDLIDASIARPNCLTIIDFDLKENDGIHILKRLKQNNPRVRSVMISSSNNIPLAVAATKLGVLEFFRKPLIVSDFAPAVEKLAEGDGARGFSFEGIPGTEWLKGASRALIEFEADLIRVSGLEKDLALYGERGIDKSAVIKLIHRNGADPAKKLVVINLNSFRKESLEGHFWVTLNELLTGAAGSNKRLEDMPGTVYIEGFEVVPDHFRASIFEYLTKKDSKSGSNREVKVVAGLCNRSYFNDLKNFEPLVIPPLRERREDITAIASELIKKRTDLKAVSPETLEFMAYYEFPGNYEELLNLLRSSFPLDGELKHASINAGSLISSVLSMTRMRPLSRLRNVFESVLIRRTINSAGSSQHLAARFLNLPKTVFDQKLKELEL